MARARGPVHRLITGSQEDKSFANDFLRERGFEVVIREPISELDLPAFDETPFVHKIQQAEASGLRLASLEDLARDYPNWQERHWQLDTAIMQDVPTPDPFSPRTLETFIRQHVGNPGFSPDVTHVAVHGDEWVGISELYIDPNHPEGRRHRANGRHAAVAAQGIGHGPKVESPETGSGQGSSAGYHGQRGKQPDVPNQSNAGLQGQAGLVGMGN